MVTRQQLSTANQVLYYSSRAKNNKPMAVDMPSPDNKPIAYISSPLINVDTSQTTSSNDYFVQLLTLIVQKIHKVIDADVVVKLAKSTSSDDQVSLIQEIFSRKEKYSGVILSPVNVSHAAQALRNHITDLNDYKLLPIITIDKQITEDINGILIPSVTSDWKKGGACAAELILSKLTIHHDDGPKNILYMPGLEGSAERIAGLTDELTKDDKEKRFTLTGLPPADFTRETAKALFDTYLKRNKNDVDFVFACNDEMALGIRDAILEARQLPIPNPLIEHTKVIGFDGTKEFTAAMNSETNDILLATVDVNLESQVDNLVEKIYKLFSKEKDYTSLESFSPDSDSYRPKKSDRFATM